MDRACSERNEYDLPGSICAGFAISGWNNLWGGEKKRTARLAKDLCQFRSRNIFSLFLVPCKE